MVSIWCFSAVAELRRTKLTRARAAMSSNSTGPASDVDAASHQAAGSNSAAADPLRSSDLAFRIESFFLFGAGPRHDLKFRQCLARHWLIPRSLISPRKLEMNA